MPTESLNVAGNADFEGLIKLNTDAGASGDIIKSNGAGSDPTWTTPTVDIPIVLSNYDPAPSGSVGPGTPENNLHGGLLKLVDADTLASGDSITLSGATLQGIGKLVFVVNAGIISSPPTV